MRRAALLVLFLLLTPTDGLAEETDDERRWKTHMEKKQDAFRFFNACEGVAPHVIGSEEEVLEKLSLTREDISNRLESRLRAAKVYEDPRVSSSDLIVNMTLLDNTCSLDVLFRKPNFIDPYSKYDMIQLHHDVTTWEKGMLGILGSHDAGPILTTISKYVDEFLVNYLRVNNEEACEKYRLAKQEWESEQEAEWIARMAEREKNGEASGFHIENSLLEGLEHEVAEE